MALQIGAAQAAWAAAQPCVKQGAARAPKCAARTRLIERRDEPVRICNLGYGSALIMPASADEFADLEARLLAKQQLQFDVLQKRLLGSASAPEEIDQPFSEYARNFYVTAAVMVCLVALMVFVAFTGGLYGNVSQTASLFIMPFCWTTGFGLVFATLDCEVAGRRAVQLLRASLFSMMIAAPIAYWTSGEQGDAVVMFFSFGLDMILYPWLLNATKEILRTRYQGSLTAQAQFYTMRALKIAGFQLVLSVSAAAQGIDGLETFPRVWATLTFSVTLPMVWMFLIAVFDACAVDGHAAAKLRVSPLQAAAIASCGALTLSGLAGFVLAEQRHPSKRAANLVMYVMFISTYLCIFFVGRLVCSARKTTSGASSAASVKPAGGLDVFDIPGA